MCLNRFKEAVIQNKFGRNILSSHIMIIAMNIIPAQVGNIFCGLCFLLISQNIQNRGGGFYD